MGSQPVGQIVCTWIKPDGTVEPVQKWWDFIPLCNHPEAKGFIGLTLFTNTVRVRFNPDDVAIVSLHTLLAQINDGFDWVTIATPTGMFHGIENPILDPLNDATAARAAIRQLINDKATARLEKTRVQLGLDENTPPMERYNIVDVLLTQYLDDMLPPSQLMKEPA